MSDSTEKSKPAERNELLEIDGLYFESETHEWFNDKSMTQYARNENQQGIALKHIVAFITRRKSDGQYMRVLMDAKKNAVIYDSTGFEDMAVYIDKLKLLMQFDNQE